VHNDNTIREVLQAVVLWIMHRSGSSATPPAPPIRACPHSTSKAATLLLGQQKPADTFSPHSASVN